MKLGEQPWIDPTAVVQGTTLGAWTAVGARTIVQEACLGDYSYVMNDSDIIYAEIGKFCSIASHTRINPGNHPMWRATQHHFTYRTPSYELGEREDGELFDWRRSHKVVLGHDVWVGHGAILLPGVMVGTGAVVGAGTVVSKHVPPYTIVAGVPARAIRRRVSEQTEEALLNLAWWDWPREKLRGAMEDFRRLDAEQFIRKYENGHG